MKASSSEGDTAELICWRELGSEAIVEQVLERNPGLADAGPILARGTIVDLPDTLPATGSSARELVQLWD